MSIVGIITSVRDIGGMAREKSMRGNWRGVTARVASQLVSATPSWLAESSERMPVKTSSQSGMSVR